MTHPICSNIRHMRWIVVFCFALVSLFPARGQTPPAPSSFPEQFEIGRRTFFDFGPPFDYYEIFVVRPMTDGSSVIRILLTPPADACNAPARVEISSATLGESIPALLGKTNPCSIPEKELRHELKRCKHCLVFSGAEVTMRVPCGANSRFIRSDILDRDMFDPNSHTPEHTSWTMKLLARLDKAIGPGVMEKPMFALPGNDQPTTEILSDKLRKELDSGAYDQLFPSTKQKPSELYLAAQAHHPPPTTRLLDIVPFRPQELILPEYPAIARAAHIEGIVSFSLVLDADGNPTTPSFAQGHPLLLEAVKRAVAQWNFPKDAAGQQIQATIEFALNCPEPSK
ncbi:MAG: energy transducer TonB [Candidatus Acidiferrum sp.]